MVINKKYKQLLSEGFIDSMIVLNKLKNKYKTDNAENYFHYLNALPNDYTKKTLFDRLVSVINELLQIDKNITKEYAKHVVQTGSEFYDEFYKIAEDYIKRLDISKQEIWKQTQYETYYYTACFILIGLQINNQEKFQNMYNVLLEKLNKFDIGHKHFGWSVLVLLFIIMINFALESAILISGAFIYLFASSALLIINEIRASRGKDRTISFTGTTHIIKK